MEATGGPSVGLAYRREGFKMSPVIARCSLLLFLAGPCLVASCEERGEEEVRLARRDEPVAPEPPAPPPPWFSGQWEGESDESRLSLVLSDDGQLQEGQLRPAGASEALTAAGVFDEASEELRLQFQAPGNTGVGVFRRSSDTLFEGTVNWSLSSADSEEQPAWVTGSTRLRLRRVHEP